MYTLIIKGVTVLKFPKVDFIAKKIIRDKKRYYIIVKGSVCQEDTIY